MNRVDDQMKSIGAEMMNALANFVGCDAPKEQPDDYIGDDGLLYCHNCHTKKQTRLKFPKEFGGGERIVPCCCKCESDRIDEEARRRKEAEQRNYIAQLKRATNDPEFIVIRMYYFNEDAYGNDRSSDSRPYTFEEISEELAAAGLQRSEKTLRSWRTRLVQDMTVTLFGIDGAVSVETRDSPRKE